MDKGFLKYVKNARREFVRDVDEQLYYTELLTSAENLIIAYDQMVSKLEQCKGKETPE